MVGWNEYRKSLAPCDRDSRIASSDIDDRFVSALEYDRLGIPRQFDEQGLVVSVLAYKGRSSRTLGFGDRPSIANNPRWYQLVSRSVPKRSHRQEASLHRVGSRFYLSGSA